MPIYAYRCAACGHAKDVLQKISDPLLTTCPSCGAEAFQKQLTAAGFQLKGSGWYVTDFKGGAPAAKPALEPATEAAKPDSKAAGEAAAPAKADASPAASTAAASTPPAPSAPPPSAK